MKAAARGPSTSRRTTDGGVPARTACPPRPASRHSFYLSSADVSQKGDGGGYRVKRAEHACEGRSVVVGGIRSTARPHSRAASRRFTLVVKASRLLSGFFNSIEI